MKSGFDPNQILEVSAAATKEEIKAAYKRLALKFHPDKANSPDQAKEFNNIFMKINAAYAELMKPDAAKTADPDLMLPMNPMEIDYLRTTFPSLTYEEIDAVSEIIEIIMNDPHQIKEFEINEITEIPKDDYFFDKEKYLDFKNDIESIYFLPYAPHPMEKLTNEELREKIELAQKHYADVTNDCT